jgi:hypothetical protein
MKTALLAGVGALALLSTACGSDAADPPKQGDFDHGTVVNVGTGGGGNVTEPPFQAYAYPAPPYGTQVGSVIQPLTLLGWKDSPGAEWKADKVEEVNIAEYYNPDGSKPWKLLWINASAVWCGPCNAEYAQMRDEDTYEVDIKPKGVQVLGTLMENGASPPGPATPTNLAAWGTKYKVKFPMGVDPAFKMGVYFEQGTIPGGVLVDAKTMTIVAKLSGGAVTGPNGVLAEIDGALAQLPQ